MFPLALVGGIVLVALAHSASIAVACSVYAASSLLLFGTSAVCHRGHRGPRGEAALSVAAVAVAAEASMASPPALWRADTRSPSPPRTPARPYDSSTNCAVRQPAKAGSPPPTHLP
jgi:hypothetical protein